MKKNLGHKSMFLVIGVLILAGFFTPAESWAAGVTEITVTAAGKGSSAYRAMAALTEVVNRYSKTVRMTNRETGGFVEGTRLVAANRVQIAMTSGPYVDYWQHKKNPFEKDPGPRDTIMGIGPEGISATQIAVLKDSNIRTFMDLKGKRVNIGPKGGSSHWVNTFALKAAGIYNTVQIESMNSSTAATYLVDHKLDAFGAPGTIPYPAILQASYSAPVRLLSIPDDVIQKFINYSKGYFKDTVNFGTFYRGMENQSITTVSYMALLAANKDVPADVVYEVTRHLYDPKNYDLLVNMASGWKSGLELAKHPKFLETMKVSGLKLHPGAARYWKEKGFKVD